MFYVADGKIYLAEFDAELKGYPECVLVRTASGKLVVKRTGTAIAEKPAAREVMSLTVLLARYRALAKPEAVKPVAPATKSATKSK